MKWLEALFALFRKPANPPFVPASPPITEPQKPSRKAIGGVAAASVIAAIVAFVQPWEGTVYRAYLDSANIPTICVGHTKGVKIGDVATQEQCDAWLIEEIKEHNIGLRSCVTRDMPANVEIALTSTTFNIGIAAMCGSTAVRKYNAGDDSGACDALLLWNKAGGRTIKGLMNRREAEKTLCLKD